VPLPNKSKQGNATAPLGQRQHDHSHQRTLARTRIAKDDQKRVVANDEMQIV
jgi:hypothetical protein